MSWGVVYSVYTHGLILIIILLPIYCCRALEIDIPLQNKKRVNPKQKSKGEGKVNFESFHYCEQTFKKQFSMYGYLFDEITVLQNNRCKEKEIHP